MDNPSLQPGARLGPYEIASLIGHGGMGVVYRARDTRLGRIVALKVVSGVEVNGKRLERFEQEARATAALNHPNIVTIHDVGAHDGQPYIVSELLEGQTLRSLLRRGALPLHSVVKWFIDICRGLSVAHGLGIVHRDLKPENLFVTTTGTLKILDFGLAKLTELSPVAMVGSRTNESGAGVILGTAGYLSPEQITGGSVDQRSDIFALGIILYEMITGRNPFRSQNAVETMNAILTRRPDPLPANGDAVLTLLGRVVERCLRVDPGERFASTDEILSVRGTRILVASSALSQDDAAISESVEEAPQNSSLWNDSPWFRWVGFPLVLAVSVPVALVTLFATLGVIALVIGGLSNLYDSYAGYEVDGCLQSGAQPGSLTLYSPSTFRTLNIASVEPTIDLRPYVNTTVALRYRFDSRTGVARVMKIRNTGASCERKSD